MRSDSVPNLSITKRCSHNISLGSPGIHRSYHRRHHFYHYSPRQSNASCRSASSNDYRLLQSELMKLHREALSIDNSNDVNNKCNSITVINIHSTDTQDYIAKSDIAKKHILSRQKPVDKDENCFSSIDSFEMKRYIK